MPKITLNDSGSIFCPTCKESMSALQLDKQPFTEGGKMGLGSCPSCGGTIFHVAYIEDNQSEAN